MGVNWNYYNRFEEIDKKYLPVYGEGETLATQAVTAVNKIVYRWYNDGDVYDNTYGMEGWANNLSTCANWLYEYLPETESILMRIRNVWNDDGYENLLKDLADTVMDSELLEKLDVRHKQDSIYSCDGPFRFEEPDEEDEW